MNTVNDQQYSGRFYGVYLLCSQSTEQRFKGKCYIGYTVNPNRRIKQHNRGREFGGAWKTNNRGPWKMVMIVHGFPNNIAALQFEWAWQQPSFSSRLKMYTELKRKHFKETYFQYNFRILSRMLNVGPWCRLPLIIRWLALEYRRDFEIDLLPPRHMQITSGEIILAKSNTKTDEMGPCVLWAPECHLCMKRIENPERSRIGCLNPLSNHMIASDIRNRGHLLPIAGECPLCETDLTWVALLQHKYKMQGILDKEADEDDDLEAEEVEFEKFNSLSDEQQVKDMNKNMDIYDISD